MDPSFQQEFSNLLEAKNANQEANLQATSLLDFSNLYYIGLESFL